VYTSAPTDQNGTLKKGRLPDWLKEAIEQSVKSLVEIASHNIDILAVLFWECALLTVIRFPILAEYREDLRPILRGAIIATIAVACLRFVTFLVLAGYKDFKRRLQEGNISERTGALIFFSVVVVIGGLMFQMYGGRRPEIARASASVSAPAQPLPPPKTTPTVAILDVTPLDREHGAVPTRCPRAVEILVLRFRFLVEQGYEYNSVLDGGHDSILNANPDGLLDQTIEHQSLRQGHHRIKVGQRKRGELAKFTEVKTIDFKITHEH